MDKTECTAQAACPSAWEPTAECWGLGGKGRGQQLPRVQLDRGGGTLLPPRPQTLLRIMSPSAPAALLGSVTALMAREDVEIAVGPWVVSGDALEDNVPAGREG